MAIDRKRWAEIQDGEFAYHAAKDENRVLEINLAYWSDVLGVLPDELRFEPETRALDLGCGGCGILLALDRGELVGVDPLMERYLAKFPFLSQRQDIEWVVGLAEEVSFDRPFDVVFTINSFDHVYDPRIVVDNIRRLLRPGGHVVLTMNCHTTDLFRSYYSRFYRVIDSHHPYQFTVDDVPRLFDGFDLVHTQDIDDLWLPYEKRYKRDVLGRSPNDRRRLFRSALNPFKWPMGFCKYALDMPPHRKRSGQKSLYVNQLFVFRHA